MKTVLVTGATGFVGRRLLQRLAVEDLNLRVLARDPARLPMMPRGRVAVLHGVLDDRALLRRAVRGADCVLHLAALARASARDPDAFRRVNVEAVRRLLAAAADAGVGRIVHVSTELVLPPVRPIRGPGAAVGPTPYAFSKRQAEALVARYVEEGGDAVVVRPTRIYGPGPWNDANGATRLAVLYLRGKLRVRPADGDVEASYVHVDDVAAGIELAARRGRRGAAYTLGGQNISLRRYLALVGELTGVRRRVVPLPPPLLAPVAHVSAAWGRLGGETSLTPAWLATFLEHRPADIAAARGDLGYYPRPLREGLAQTLAWVRDQAEGPWHGTVASRS